MSKLTPKTLIVCLLFINILFAIFLGSQIAKNEKRDITKINIFRDSKDWKEEINRVGPDVAYSEFKKAYKGKDTAHGASHIFSMLLYEVEGIDGISYCDQTFFNGCYHGFFSAAISNEGLGAIKKLDKVCKERFGGGFSICHHGIGHGLLEYYGTKSLSKALDGCLDLDWKGKVFGCTSGVFMENNFPLLLSKNNTVFSEREVDLNNPYYPCNVVDSKFQPSCYHELSQILRRKLNKDYSKIGIFCDGVAGSENKQFCFLGIGYYAPNNFDYVVDDVISACELMPSSEGIYWCKMGASLGLSYTQEKKIPQQDIDKLCEQFKGSEFIECNSGRYYNDNNII